MLERGVLSRSLPSQFDHFFQTTAAARCRSIFPQRLPHPGYGTVTGKWRVTHIGANPQIAAATANGARNRVPFFIAADGPVREARFPFVVSNGSVTHTPDGGVHDLFTIAGRSDAGSCTLAQPNFELMNQLNNLIFRIPTPVFGAGLIENIADATILANMHANASLKQHLAFPATPTPAATTALSRDSAGKRRTNRLRSLLARPTTWR
jgi:hypothetical protein